MILEREAYIIVNMRKFKALIAGGLAIAYLAAPLTVVAADSKNEKAKKPYKLDTCLVSDEKLGEMGDPFVFVHKGQEVKLCCKSCQKDFKKATAKYMKKLEKAEKEKAKKS